MERGLSNPLRRTITQIIEEEDLAPDLLTRVGQLLQLHDEADDLYRWTMRLAPHLGSRDVQIIGRLLQNGLNVLSDRDPTDLEPATTLPRTTRRTIRTLAQSDGDAAGPAMFVLGFDVVTRAYNRARHAEPVM